MRTPSSGMSAAAFDTRVSGHPMLVKLDRAARTEEKLLGKLGAEVVAPAEHSFVADTKLGRTLAELARRLTRAAPPARPSVAAYRQEIRSPLDDRVLDHVSDWVTKRA